MPNKQTASSTTSKLWILRIKLHELNVELSNMDHRGNVILSGWFNEARIDVYKSDFNLTIQFRKQTNSYVHNWL